MSNVTFYIEAEEILRTLYPKCPLPYFIDGDLETHTHVFTFGRKAYLEAISEYYNPAAVRASGNYFSVQAETPYDLAQNIYLLAIIYELDETKFLSNIEVENNSKELI
jgi:hypothetical protein